MQKKKEKIPVEIKKLVKERESARKERDWVKSDKIREKLKNLGYFVEDSKSGTRVKKLN